MPTNNPRINVTLSPSTDALVSKLASLQGTSKSQVLRELLNAAEPALQRAAALMEAASRARNDVLGGLAQSLERAQDQAESLAAAALGELDDLVRQAEAVRPRRPKRVPSVAASKGGAAASTPVSVTRGSGTPGRGKKGKKDAGV